MQHHVEEVADDIAPRDAGGGEVSESAVAAAIGVGAASEIPDGRSDSTKVQLASAHMLTSCWNLLMLFGGCRIRSRRRPDFHRRSRQRPPGGRRRRRRPSGSSGANLWCNKKKRGSTARWRTQSRTWPRHRRRVALPGFPRGAPATVRITGVSPRCNMSQEPASLCLAKENPGETTGHDLAYVNTSIWLLAAYFMF